MSGFYFEWLPDATDTTKFLATPTVSAGDFKIRQGGTGTPADLTDLPTVADGIVKVTVTSAEAVGQGIIFWEDPDGEWLPGYFQFNNDGAAEEEVAESLLDLADGVESGMTVRGALRIILAAAAGKLSGAGGTNIKIRDVNDTKDRIDAIVDANGSRSAVTLDPS